MGCVSSSTSKGGMQERSGGWDAVHMKETNALVVTGRESHHRRNRDGLSASSMPYHELFDHTINEDILKACATACKPLNDEPF